MSEWRKTEPGGCYLVTLQVVDGLDLFVRPEYATIVLDSLAYCVAHKGLQVYAYCLMTSQLHLIAQAEKPLSAILRDLKAHTARQLYAAVANNPFESRRDWLLGHFHSHGQENPHNQTFQVWQQGNQPFELWSDSMMTQKMDEIHQSPVLAGFVTDVAHYAYSSAHANPAVPLTSR